MHRIVWREDPNKPIQDYRLLTATYGTASRPFHATRVLHKLAEDEERDLPLASAVARRDFYVDDVMSGANTESEALEVQSQLLELMKRGGMDLRMDLRKWSSNSAALLESLPSELRETQLPLNFDSDEAIKTLGLRWNPATDEFGFKGSRLSRTWPSEVCSPGWACWDLLSTQFYAHQFLRERAGSVCTFCICLR